MAGSANRRIKWLRFHGGVGDPDLLLPFHRDTEFARFFRRHFLVVTGHPRHSLHAALRRACWNWTGCGRRCRDVTTLHYRNQSHGADRTFTGIFRVHRGMHRARPVIDVALVVDRRLVFRAGGRQREEEGNREKTDKSANGYFISICRLEWSFADKARRQFPRSRPARRARFGNRRDD